MKALLAAHGLAFGERDGLDMYDVSGTEYDGLMRPLNITLASCKCKDVTIKLPATVENEAAHWDAGEGPAGPSKHLFIDPAAVKALVKRKPVVRSFIRRYGVRPEWSTSMTLRKKDDPRASSLATGDEPQLMIFGHASYWSVAITAPS